MSEHRATIDWQRSSADFTYMTYNRAHDWRFTAATVAASATKEYRGDESRVNPEEALVASLSSCHMLTFLYLAFRSGVDVVSYDDDAVGVIAQNEAGAPWISSIKLHPKLAFGSATEPDAREIARLHHEAHAQCFIANSIKTTVNILA